MRGTFLPMGFVFGSLFLASPISATSYSASVGFDLTTLTFSGIPVSFTTVIPPGTFHPSSPSTVEAEHRNTRLIEHSSANTTVAHNTLSPNWVHGSLTEHLPGVGTVTALGSPTEIFSSINLLSSGVGDSLIARHALLTATQEGTLTVSINYAITHSGVLIGDSDFSSVGRAGLSVGNMFDVKQQTDFRDLHLSTQPFEDAPRDQRGTASVSYSFNAGQSAPLSLFTNIGATVPVPDMLWLTIIGICGIAILAERWRYRASSV
jgi:hypothetical protein